MTTAQPLFPAFLAYFRGWLNWLLLFFPAALILHFMHASDAVVFGCACLSIVPLAGLMGHATEQLAERAGSGIGGLLNATFGNAAELIIAITALQKGLGGVVKASLTGSIIGNLLFVMGLSVLAGGLKFRKQVFNRTAAGSGVTMMLVAVMGMLVPAVYHHLVGSQVPSRHLPNLETMSLIIAGVLIFNYVCGLLFSLRTHHEYFQGGPAEGAEESDAADYLEGGSRSAHRAGKHPSIGAAILVLLLATVSVVVASEMLVGTLEPVMHKLGLSELFVGAVVLAIIGNAAEHSTAVMVAMRNKLDLSMQICVGSSIQIALFVTPALVFISLFMGRPMTLEFTVVEILAILATIFVVLSAVYDGETNWFEGVQLLSLYAVLAVAFFFL